MSVLFRQLFDKVTSTYTYLIADLEAKQAVLVDAVLEQVQRDLSVLKRLELDLVCAFDTHIHADHISALEALRQKTDCKIGVPHNDATQNADFLIEDGQCLDCGQVQIQAISTPGHTAAHMAYFIDNKAVLTGDALFIGGCGRTDFQEGDAGALYDSVWEKLFSLPPTTLVYPGHDYNGLTVSTIAEEKQHNPRLTLSREAFIGHMQALNLPPPQQLEVAVPRNFQCGAPLA